MALKPKPKDQQKRMVFTDDPGRAMPEHKGKVFAVIGPFESLSDDEFLQNILENVLRGYNFEV